MMRWLRKNWPFLFFFILLIILFGKLFYPHLSLFVTPDFGESDILNFNYPLKDFLSQSLKRYELPLWSKDLNTGFPLLAEGQIGALYLPNLLLFFFLPTTIAFNLSYILHVTLAFFSMFLLTKKLKFNQEASFLSAFSFAFSFYLVAHFCHLNLLQASCLLPLIFYLFLLLLEKPSYKNILLFSFSLSQQLFAGYVYMTFITGFTCLLYFLMRLFLKKERLLLTPKLLLSLIVSLILFLLLSAVQILPTGELASLSNRQSGLSYQAVVSYPFPPKHLFSFLKPYAFGNPQLGTYPPFSNDWGIFWENTPYIGIIPLILAVLSLFLIKKNSLVLIFWLMIFISLLLALGKYSPLYLIFSFPVFNFFRVPSRYLLMTVFSLTILSGFGFNHLLKLVKRNSLMKKLIYLAILTITIFDLFSYVTKYNPQGKACDWLKIPETAKFLKNQKKEGRIINFGQGQLWNSVFLKDGWKDLLPYQYFQNGLFPNANLLYNLSSFQINTGGLKIRKNEIILSLVNEGLEIDFPKKTATLSALAAKILSMYNVRYVVTPLTFKTSKELTKIFSVKSPKDKLYPYNIYENKEVLPRFFVSDNYKKVASLEEFLQALASKNFAYQKEILLASNFPLKDKTVKEPLNFKIEKIKDQNQQIAFKVKSNKKAVFVLTDTFYPGWQALVNGQKTTIFPVNLTSRGIIIDRGQSTVEFVYQPFYFRLGLLITIATYTILTLIFLYTRVSR